MTAGQPPPSAADPLVGKVISERYRIIRKLGEGGMGTVYLAEHVLIEKKVALKLLAPELTTRTDLAARFLQEARSASRIGHEHVIDISDFGQSADGYVYIAMEYLDGIDLGESVRRGGPLGWPRARGIVLQICKALRAAHAQGIVHRDMKPENIFLIQREGHPDFVKLLDFGIAKVIGLDPGAPRLTRTGMIFGTPEYMAPEQAEGKDADHRVDIYAVGCVIYHLVTGEPPFKADSFMTMLTKHLLEDPVAPSARRPDLRLSPALDALVLRALEKDRARRWQNMDELMRAVLACEPDSGVIPIGPGSPTVPLGGAGLTPGRMAAAHPADAELGLDEGSFPPMTARSRPASRKVAVIVAGALVGTAAALWWALGARPTSPAKTPREPTAHIAGPSPVPPPPSPPAAAPVPEPAPAAPPAPPAHATEAPSKPARPGSHPPARRLERPAVRRIPSLPDEPALTAPVKRSPQTPPELKPFPQ